MEPAELEAEQQDDEITFAEAIADERSNTRFIWEYYERTRLESEALFKKTSLLAVLPIAGALTFLGVSSVADIKSSLQDAAGAVNNLNVEHRTLWVLLGILLFALAIFLLLYLTKLFQKFSLFRALKPLPLSSLMFNRITVQGSGLWQPARYKYFLRRGTDKQHAEWLANYLSPIDMARSNWHYFGLLLIAVPVAALTIFLILVYAVLLMIWLNLSF